MTIAFVLAFVMNVGSYWFSDKIVLSMYGAQPVDEAQAPQLYRIVRELAAQAKIPVPPIYLIQDDSPNAFATGRNPQHAAVAVTEGILRIMTEDELPRRARSRALARQESRHAHHDDRGHARRRHHLPRAHGSVGGHLRRRPSRDERGGRWGRRHRRSPDGHPGAPSRPCSSRWPSRGRASTKPTPRAPASSAAPPDSSTRLQKLDMASRQEPMDATPATAHLFIVNPLTSDGLATLFSTHPPIEERIARLRAMRL